MEIDTEQTLEERATELVETADDSGDQSTDEPDETLSKGQEDEETEQLETGDEETKEEAKETEEPDEGQDDLIKQAAENLEKVHGKKLSEDELAVELSRSHLNAGEKIQSQQEQIKDLVPIADAYDDLVADPNIAEYLAAKKGGYTPPAQDQNVQAQMQGLDPQTQQMFNQLLYQAVKPLQDKLAAVESNITTKAATEQGNAMNAQFTELASKDKLFKRLWDEYENTAAMNKRVKPAGRLKDFLSLVRGGATADRAWKTATDDLQEKRFKTKVANAQQKKLGKNTIHKSSGAKGTEPDLTTMSTEEKVRHFVEQGRSSA